MAMKKQIPAFSDLHCFPAVLLYQTVGLLSPGTGGTPGWLPELAMTAVGTEGVSLGNGFLWLALHKL